MDGTVVGVDRVVGSQEAWEKETKNEESSNDRFLDYP